MMLERLPLHRSRQPFHLTVAKVLEHLIGSDVQIPANQFSPRFSQ